MRLIRVNHNYGGHVTNEVRIEPGVYAENDPRLLGVGDYLIQHGHAELAGVVEEPPAEEALPAAEESSEGPPAEDPVPPKRKK